MSPKYTYIGHGTHLLQTGGHTLIIDPFINGNPATTLTVDDVECNFILVTHGHGDHVGDAVAIAQRTGAPCIANAKVCKWLEAQGAPKTHNIYFGGWQTFPFGRLKMTIAFHGSSLPDGSDGGSPGGYLMETNEKERIYFAGDTALFGDMALIGEEGLDLAVLPIGDHYTMGPDDALRAVKLLIPKHVVPSHYNTWPVVAQDGEAWAKRVKAETKATPHVLKPGESVTL
ncbi:MAG: metal-dependent hydrolase [Chloroflexi bacterium]|nr:metal-dependent hydrolase [Chloroflexota bacterium]